MTCIQWVPGSSNLFVTSHASGQLYVYNEELSCGSAAPHYQLFKQGDGYSVHTCRTKSTRNPLYRWLIGTEPSCINEFAFSPCGSNIATVSQDGFLRVFHYNTMELIGKARSYFGGFLCVCWSPDGKYVVVGGEDDLVTVWCFGERRVAARCQGHKSWVSVVAFDPYVVDFGDPNAEESDEKRKGENVQCYRLGSVSQDTQLCLWDLTEDVLKPPVRARASTHLSPNGQTFANGGPPGLKPPPKAAKTNKIGHKHAELSGTAAGEPSGAKAKTLNISVGGKEKKEESGTLGVNSITQRLAGFSFGERRSDHRRNFSLTKPAESKGSAANSVSLRKGGAPAEGAGCDALRLMGTAACPRFDECPVLEPLVCKRIAHERLTALQFRAEYFVTACADGCVHTWARPRPEPRAPRRAGTESIHRVD